MAEAVGAAGLRRQPRYPLLPIVDQGCCCSLEACCKAQGIFTAVWSCLSIIAGLRDMIFGTNNYTICPSCDPNEFVSEFASDSGRERGIGLLSLFIFMVLDLITLGCALLFLKGIAERKPSLMDHYIRLFVVRIVVNAVVVFVMAVVSGNVMVFIFVLAFISGIPYYMLVCAHSLQYKLMSPMEDIEMAAAYPPPPYGYGGTSGYPPPAPGYAPPAPGYAVPPPGYAPAAPEYAPARPGYAPPGPAPPGFAPQYVPQDNLYPTKALDGSSPTMV